MRLYILMLHTLLISPVSRMCMCLCMHSLKHAVVALGLTISVHRKHVAIASSLNRETTENPQLSNWHYLTLVFGRNLKRKLKGRGVDEKD